MDFWPSQQKIDKLDTEVKTIKTSTTQDNKNFIRIRSDNEHDNRSVRMNIMRNQM